MAPSIDFPFRDAFLEMHYAGRPLVFTIGGVISPISVRDQMVRAQMFVKRAIAEGLIGSEKPLLVVGGGAGGVAAALHAAELDVPVTLMERKKALFHLQQSCSSRWLDPVQYDWPAAHWDQGMYPWESRIDLPSAVLPWGAGKASLIAVHWNALVKAARVEFDKKLDIRFSTEFLTALYEPGEDRVVVLSRKTLPEHAAKRQREDWSKVRPERFGAVLLAVGFGVENVQCGSYRSPRFWQKDEFEKPRLGLKPKEKELRVLVCGDGDGALQDFLRIATGLSSAKEILGRLLSEEYGTPSCVEAQIERRIYEAEDQAHRARLWSGYAADHATLTRLDAEHRACAHDVLRHEKTALKAWVVMGKLLEHVVGLDLKLIHRCEHFTALYPLNRFLVHLIVEYLKLGGSTGLGKPKIEVLSGQRVLDVQCQDHDLKDKAIGQEDAHFCHGKPHRVHLAEDGDCRKPWQARSAAPGEDRHELYDVVVLRLGLNRDQMPGALGLLPALRPRRHSLPYHPPV